MGLKRSGWEGDVACSRLSSPSPMGRQEVTAPGSPKGAACQLLGLGPGFQGPDGHEALGVTRTQSLQEANIIVRGKREVASRFNEPKETQQPNAKRD